MADRADRGDRHRVLADLGGSLRWAGRPTRRLTAVLARSRWRRSWVMLVAGLGPAGPLHRPQPDDRATLCPGLISQGRRLPAAKGFGLRMRRGGPHLRRDGPSARRWKRPNPGPAQRAAAAAGASGCGDGLPGFDDCNGIDPTGRGAMRHRAAWRCRCCRPAAASKPDPAPANEAVKAGRSEALYQQQAPRRPDPGTRQNTVKALAAAQRAAADRGDRERAKVGQTSTSTPTLPSLGAVPGGAGRTQPVAPGRLD